MFWTNMNFLFFKFCNLSDSILSRLRETFYEAETIFIQHSNLCSTLGECFKWKYFGFFSHKHTFSVLLKRITTLDIQLCFIKSWLSLNLYPWKPGFVDKFFLCKESGQSVLKFSILKHIRFIIIDWELYEAILFVLRNVYNYIEEERSIYKSRGTCFKLRIRDCLLTPPHPLSILTLAANFTSDQSLIELGFSLSSSRVEEYVGEGNQRKPNQ